jgi:hypothetical protein
MFEKAKTILAYGGGAAYQTILGKAVDRQCGWLRRISAYKRTMQGAPNLA